MPCRCMCISHTPRNSALPTHFTWGPSGAIKAMMPLARAYAYLHSSAYISCIECPYPVQQKLKSSAIFNFSFAFCQFPNQTQSGSSGTLTNKYSPSGGHELAGFEPVNIKEARQYWGHVVEAGTMWQAVMLKTMGHYNEAQEMYKRCIRIKERTLGPGHPQVWSPSVTMGYQSVIRYASATQGERGRCAFDQESLHEFVYARAPESHDLTCGGDIRWTTLDGKNSSSSIV